MQLFSALLLKRAECGFDCLGNFTAVEGIVCYNSAIEMRVVFHPVS